MSWLRDALNKQFPGHLREVASRDGVLLTRGLATSLAVLRAAAHLLGMPLYIFGNDIKELFNHFENAPSELPLMNIGRGG